MFIGKIIASSSSYLNSLWPRTSSKDIKFDTQPDSLSFGGAMGTLKDSVLKCVRYALDNPKKTCLMSLALLARGVNAEKRQLDPTQVPISTDVIFPSLVGSYNNTSLNFFNVEVSGNLALLFSSNLLEFIDITNPALPTFISSFSTSGLLNAAISNDAVYLANSAFGINILNISNPSNPLLAGSIPLSNEFDGVSFVAASGSNIYAALANHGIRIFDASNPGSPQFLGDTRDIAVRASITNDLLYVTLQDSTFGPVNLQVIDVSPPLIAPIPLALTDTPSQAVGIFVSGSIALVADQISGLQIFDISNPASPSLIGNFNTPSSAEGIYVVGTLAFIADSSSLQIIDISNPAAPSFVGSFIASGIGKVFVDGNRAYLTGSFSSFITPVNLRIIDISNPGSPNLLGSYATTPTEVIWNVVVESGIGYISASSSFRIVDLSNPASPVLLSSYPVLQGESVRDVEIVGSIAYVLIGGSSFTSFRMEILDVTNLNSPILINTHTIPFDPVDLFLESNRLYVTSSRNLEILDITTPAAPISLASYSTGSSSRETFVLNNIAFIAEGIPGIETINVADPLIPPRVLSDIGISTNGGGALSLVNNIAYITSGSGRLQVVDVTNSMQPLIIGNYNPPITFGGLQDVVATPNFAFGRGGSLGSLIILDVRNPQMPMLAGNYTAVDNLGSLAASNNLVYVPVANNGLQILQVDFVPVLTSNQFEIRPGQRLQLDSSHLSATDEDNDPNSLVFIVSELQRAIFQDDTGNQVTFFTQQQVVGGDIFVIHDGSDFTPTWQISVSDGIARTPPVSAQTNLASGSSTDNTGAIVGGIFAGLFALCCSAGSAAGIYAYREYRRKHNDVKELEVELGNKQDKYHDTFSEEASARKVAGRYQIYDEMVPKHQQSEYMKLTGVTQVGKLEPLGRGNFGETWVAYDEKAPEDSSFKFLAVKKVKSSQHFNAKLREAEIQRTLNGINLQLISTDNAYDILHSGYLSDEEKRNKLGLKSNCFYLIPQNKKKSAFDLAYLDTQKKVQYTSVVEDRKFKSVNQQIKTLSSEGIEAIFHRLPCSYEIEERSVDLTNKKELTALTKNLNPLTYYAVNDGLDWHVYFKKPNRELESKNIGQEVELIKALSSSDREKLGQLFAAFHEKEYHYEKNKLLRLITNKVPYENIVDLSHHTMPVLDYFIQQDELYILTPLAPFNGEAVKALLADPQVDKQLKEQWLMLIAHDLLEAVSYLHSQGVVHDDIKLDNLVFKNGKMLLIDYGESESLPQSLDPKELSAKYLKGHLAFNPPEALPANQKDNELLNHRLTDLKQAHQYMLNKDVWAVGATLLGFYLGESNPFSVNEDFVNPSDNLEWGQACSLLKTKGTFEHFSRKVKQLDQVPQTPFVTLLKNLLVVKGNRDLLKAKEAFIESTLPLLNQAKAMRAGLFQKLSQRKTTSTVISAPTIKQGNTYLGHVTSLNYPIEYQTSSNTNESLIYNN